MMQFMLIKKQRTNLYIVYRYIKYDKGIKT